MRLMLMWINTIDREEYKCWSRTRPGWYENVDKSYPPQNGSQFWEKVWDSQEKSWHLCWEQKHESARRHNYPNDSSGNSVAKKKKSESLLHTVTYMLTD